MFDLHPMR